MMALVIIVAVVVRWCLILVQEMVLMMALVTIVARDHVAVLFDPILKPLWSTSTQSLVTFPIGIVSVNPVVISLSTFYAPETPSALGVRDGLVMVLP